MVHNTQVQDRRVRRIHEKIKTGDVEFKVQDSVVSEDEDNNQ
jgi:hypothetical protein